MIPTNLKTPLFTVLSLFTAGLVHATIVIDEGLDNSGLDSAISNISGKAANFVMPAGDDFLLTSIILGIGSINSGADPIVQLWSDDGTSAPIGTLVETLTDPGTFTADAANTFTSSGTTLSASTTYWVVVSNSDSNSFRWLGNNGPGDTIVTSDIGATHTARLFGGGDPASWSSSSSVLNQIQVNATVVPEPSSFALLSGLMAFGWMACRRRR
jgi:hypothetical protein